MPATRGHLRPLPRPDEDADQLLAAVARGDEQAFTALYDLVAPTVVGITRRVLRDPAQAEEVAQEVLLEVWRQAARHRPERGSARTWISTIAHRRAVDRVRSEQSERNRRDRDASREVTVAHDPVAESVADRSDKERVLAALSELTTVQRETVELAYFGGHTYAQVAEMMDLPLGTVKTRIRDALIRLRDTLGVSV